jgi:leader peptidase (prepilin peptidase)/N-methyltransferase
MIVLVVCAVLGAAVGSFLNVVIHRLPDPNLSVSSPRRSFCPRCKSAIAWYDNLPILSYFILLGRCRSCHLPIPLRYLVVEILTACLFLFFAAARLPSGDASRLTGTDLLVLAIQLAVVASAIAITWIDWDLKIIPDEITLPGCVLLPFLSALAPALQDHPHAWTFHQLSAVTSPPIAGYLTATIGELAGMGALLVLVSVFSRLIPLYWRALRRMRKAAGQPTSSDEIPSRVEAMGLGDVKYLALIGAAVGPEGAFLCFLLACLVGALVGVVFRFVTGDREVPFGPFLSVGLIAIMLAGEQLIQGLTHFLHG